MSAWMLGLARRPTSAVLLLMLLVLVPALLLADWGSRQWLQRQSEELLAASQASLQQRERSALKEIEALLGLRRALLQHWSGDLRLARLLQLPADSQAQAEAQAFLAELVRSGLSDLTWLIDPQGLCLAASNAGAFDSPVGERYADREYFQQAMAGGLGRQYAIGRRTRTAGLHHAMAVRDAQGQVLGVLASKLELSRVVAAMRLRDGYVSDRLGVLIVASRPAWVGKVLPDAPLWQEPAPARQARYARSHFEALPLREVALPEAPALRVLELEDGLPALLHTLALPDQSLSVHLLEPLGGLRVLRRQAEQLRWGLLLAQLLAVWAGSVSLLYGLRSREHGRQMQVKNQELAQLNRLLVEQAETDALTGVANRRRLQQRLDDELQRRAGHPLTLAVLDIDHFKRVNDAYGHAVGDAALRHVASELQLGLRGGDLLARLGGEEFVLLQFDTPLAAAQVALERLRERLLQRPLAGSGERPSLPITLSIGVATANEGESSEALLARADAAMYAAKQAGRNRVCLAS